MNHPDKPAVRPHLLRAAELLGGQARIAAACEVSQAQVWQWAADPTTRHYRPVPPLKAAAIERATDGAVTRIQLRPLDWWQHWPELAERHPHLVPAQAAQQAG